jgi:hypothetical protein
MFEFEVVEFYPTITESGKFKKYDKKYIGSLHIYFTKLGVDLRGIRVVVNSKNGLTRFYMPNNISFDYEDKKEIKYPVFEFTDRDKKKLFLDKLHEIAKPYVIKTLKEHPLMVRDKLRKSGIEKSKKKINL